MSELFPSRRRVVGGGAAGLGGLVNFVGAGRTVDAGPAIAEVGNVIQSYADVHFNKVADEKLNSFTSEVLNAANTFNYKNDASEFGASYQDKIAAMATGMPAIQANQFTANAQKVLTRAQSTLIAQAYQKDVEDQKANDIKELSDIIIGIPQAIQDTSESFGVFETEVALGDAVSPDSVYDGAFSARENFEISVEGMMDSIDIVMDSINNKLEQMEASGLYVGDQDVLDKYKSSALRQVSSFIADGFISSLGDQDLLEAGESAIRNVLPETLKDLNEYYSQLSVTDQRAFNGDLVRSIKSQLQHNKNLNDAVNTELTAKISEFKALASTARLDFDSFSFKDTMQDISNAIIAANQSGLPDVAKKLNDILLSEAKDFSEQEQKNLVAAYGINTQIKNLATIMQLTGSNRKQIFERIETLKNTFGKVNSKGEIQDFIAFEKALEQDFVSLNKTFTLNEKVSTDEKALMSLQLNTTKVGNQVALLPIDIQEKYYAMISEVVSSSNMNTKDRAETLNKISVFLEDTYKNYRSMREVYDTAEIGSAAHRKSVTSLFEKIVGQRFDQGDLPNLFAAVLEPSKTNTLQKTLERDSSYDFARDEELDDQIKKEEALRRGFTFLKEELDAGKPSDLITTAIKNAYFSPLPATPEEQELQVQNVMQLAQGLYQLYGDKTMFEERPGAVSKFKGLSPGEEAFARSLITAVSRNQSDNQFRNILSNKGTIAKLEEDELKTRINDAMAEIDVSTINLQDPLKSMVLSGDPDIDASSEGKVPAYFRSEMRQILVSAPNASAKVLADMAMRNAYRDGLRFSRLGLPFNIAEIDNAQRYSFMPPDGVYVGFVKKFEEFALEQIAAQADIPEEVTFFSRGATGDRRKNGRNLSLKEIRMGVNVFFHKIESSPNERPLYHVYAKTKSGLMGALKRKDGSKVVIDYNDKFRGDEAIQSQKRKNEVFREAARQRNLDLFDNTLSKLSPRKAAKIIADETTEESLNVPPPKNELEYSRYTTANPPPMEFKPDESVVDQLSPEEYPDFDAEGLPLEELGDFDASPLPPEETADFDASPASPAKQVNVEKFKTNLSFTPPPPGRNAYSMPPLVQLTQSERQNLETPKASGFDTVDSAARVVDAVFGGGEFLRRIAFVESDYGVNKATFSRTDRGIWQISPVGLKEVKRNTSALRDARKRVSEVFGIDVMQLEKEDMDKPLQNAIVARLFLHSKSNGAALPTTLDAQAQFWKRFYNTSAGKGTVKGFLRRVLESQQSDELQ
tara:strand:- start:1253 stop:5023 length:3771 start_codon:yes stop_codon:yes gene_type:complete